MGDSRRAPSKPNGTAGHDCRALRHDQEFRRLGHVLPYVFSISREAGCCEASVRNAFKDLEIQRVFFRRPMASLGERGRWQQRCNSFFLFPEADAPAPVGPVHDGTKGSTYHGTAC